MQKVTLDEAKEKLLILIEEAGKGEEIIITDCDKPIAKLVSIKPVPQFGSAKGLIAMSDDFDAPLEEFKEYME